MPLARILGNAGAARGAALQARSTRSSTRACTRGSASRRRTATASASAGTARATTPAVFKSIEPAWNDRNLRELAGHVRSGLVFAHIRASTGTPVQQTNCHPFRHGRWLWMHNGSITQFHDVKRDLMLAVDPSLYPDVEGSTDSEAFFFLALTLGLEDDPPGAVARAVGLIEEVGRTQRHRASDPDDRGDERRRPDLGLPLLERGEVALALLLDAGRHAARAVPGQPDLPRSSPTRAGSSSRSRSATSPARGTRCPSRATA